MTTAPSTPRRDPELTDPALRIMLLGGFDVEIDQRPVPPSAWRLRKASELVKLLALTAGHRLHREQVMELLWPDRPLGSAANNFHQALHVARSAMSGNDDSARRLLDLQAGMVTFATDVVWVDVEAFETAVRQASSSRDRAEYEAARDLYRGELLPDDRYLDWAAPRRDELAQDYLAVLTEIARSQEGDGDRDAAIVTFRRLLELDPADESAHRGLMRLYATGDRRRLALRQFEQLRATLGRELDAEPSEESRALYREILEGRLGPSAATVVRGPVADRVPTSEPGLAARHRTMARRPHNLPIQLSSFLGREREMREIERLLLATRILTLTGTGGAGKTRLAIEAGAAQLSHYRDGVWLVELGAVRQPGLVAQAIAEVFDVRDQPGGQLVQLVARSIGDKDLAILLDNCEHLVDAAATVAAGLLGACPNLRIVATSRQALRIPGEIVFRVPSLPIPEPDADDPDELGSIDSVRLFVERAQATSPEFALSARNAADVARLCYHLDGLPLAIELAASRVAVLPVSAIADRLDDRFRLLVGGSRTALTRQQTLRATLDWSYNLLTDGQRRVLRALSVFVGGVPVDGAELTCQGVGIDQRDVLGILAELADQSLLVADDVAGEPRYHLLETVREYGHDLLIEHGERTRVEAVHAAWALGLAERAEEAHPHPAWGNALGRLERELDNLRAALEHTLSDDPEAALAMAARLWRFWLWQGHLAEGRRWLERALGREPERGETRARALIGLAALTIRSGDPGEGFRRAEEAAEIYRELGDGRGRCRALQVMGGAPWSEDHLDVAEAVYRSSLAAAAQAGFEGGRAAALDGLAVVLWYLGRRPEAEALLDESLAVLRSRAESPELVPNLLDLGEFVVREPVSGTYRIVFEETFSPFQDLPFRIAIGYVMTNRAVIYRVIGDNDRARSDMEAALELFRAIGDERAIAHGLGRLGTLATATGEFARARDHLEECLSIRHRLGDSRGIGLAQGNLGNLAIAEGDTTRAQALLDESATAFHRRGDRWGYGTALGNLASLALAKGEIPRARRLLEESLVAVRSTGRIRWIAWTLVQLAAVARLDGEPGQAASLGADALAIFRRLGDLQGEAECLSLGAGSVAPREPTPARARTKRGRIPR